VPHTYKVVTPRYGVRIRQRKNIPETVTFKTPDADLFPLPDPRLLKTHAACANVAHLSGAAKYMDDMLDNIDQGGISVLSEDGSSFALQMALARRSDINVYG
jgi:hypothetical protein